MRLVGILCCALAGALLLPASFALREPAAAADAILTIAASRPAAKEVGAHALLLKPLSRDELGQAVAQALQTPSAAKFAARA